MGRRRGATRFVLVEEEEVTQVSGVVVASMCKKLEKSGVSLCEAHIAQYAPPIIQTIGGAYSNMRLAYAATYHRPGPQELLEAHMTICASHIIKYRRRI